MEAAHRHPRRPGRDCRHDRARGGGPRGRAPGLVARRHGGDGQRGQLRRVDRGDADPHVLEAAARSYGPDRALGRRGAGPARIGGLREAAPGAQQRKALPLSQRRQRGRTLSGPAGPGTSRDGACRRAMARALQGERAGLRLRAQVHGVRSAEFRPSGVAQRGVRAGPALWASHLPHDHGLVPTTSSRTTSGSRRRWSRGSCTASQTNPERGGPLYFNDSAARRCARRGSRARRPRQARIATAARRRPPAPRSPLRLAAPWRPPRRRHGRS